MKLSKTGPCSLSQSLRHDSAPHLTSKTVMTLHRTCSPNVPRVHISWIFQMRHHLDSWAGISQPELGCPIIMEFVHVSRHPPPSFGGFMPPLRPFVHHSDRFTFAMSKRVFDLGVCMETVNNFTRLGSCARCSTSCSVPASQMVSNTTPHRCSRGSRWMCITWVQKAS